MLIIHKYYNHKLLFKMLMLLKFKTKCKQNLLNKELLEHHKEWDKQYKIMNKKLLEYHKEYKSKEMLFKHQQFKNK